MLIRFAFENYTSFATRAELSFVANHGGDHPDHLRRLRGLDVPLLPVLGLYGANAAGKSNALAALSAMVRMVRRSLDPEGAPAAIKHAPFKLRDELMDAPTIFDAEFVLNEVRYRYGFAYTATRIVREWLHAWPHGTKQVWFERSVLDEDGWYFGPGWRLLRHRAATETLASELFLSTAARRNHPEAAAINAMFGRWTRAEAPLGGRGLYPKSPLFEQANAPFVLSLLRGADLGVKEFRVLNMRTRLMENLKRGAGMGGLEEIAAAIDRLGDPLSLQLGHEGADGRTVWLEPEEESDGTAMLINHLHSILTALDEGGLLIIDEFDQTIHPHLGPELLRFFTDSGRNPRGAQLVFTAHQTALMPHLRRDEVYVVEKAAHGESTLASIAEFRALKREDIERFYRAGRFGGVPRLGGIRAAIEKDLYTPSAPGAL